MSRKFRLAVIGALAAFLLAGGGGRADESSSCLDSVLTFETSALERIVRDPDGVLANEDRFWEEEPAQQFTTAWAENNGFRISRGKWRKRVSSFAELDGAARLESELMRTTEAILNGREEFLARALPHVCSFLPANVDTGVPVYFTAFIPPRAFVTGGIVINVNATYVAGAHMAVTIDSVRGWEALLQTLAGRDARTMAGGRKE